MRTILGVLLMVLAMTGGAMGLESTDYRVERTDGAFEIRDYPAVVVAEVTRTGGRGSAVRAAFTPLADYIFAKDRPGAKIAMTAPVTQTEGGDSWTVRFLMPKGSTLADLPTPGGDVRLSDVAPRKVAAIRFSGFWSDGNFQGAEDRLRAWMTGQGLRGTGPATFAYYNAPFTPWFMRRNEVMIPIEGGNQ